METPLRMATVAGGMHPTGMHSCFIYFHGFYILLHLISRQN